MTPGHMTVATLVTTMTVDVVAAAATMTIAVAGTMTGTVMIETATGNVDMEGIGMMTGGIECLGGVAGSVPKKTNKTVRLCVCFFSLFGYLSLCLLSPHCVHKMGHLYGTPS